MKVERRHESCLSALISEGDIGAAAQPIKKISVPLGSNSEDLVETSDEEGQDLRVDGRYNGSPMRIPATMATKGHVTNPLPFNKSSWPQLASTISNLGMVQTITFRAHDFSLPNTLLPDLCNVVSGECTKNFSPRCRTCQEMVQIPFLIQMTSQFCLSMDPQ